MANTPCSCKDLQTGVKILSIVDIVLCCIALVFTVIELAAVVRVISTSNERNHEIRKNDFDNNEFQIQHNNNVREFQNTATTLALVFAVTFVVVILLQLFLGITLYTGASKRSYKRCQVWFVITIVLTVLNVLVLFRGSNIGVSLVRVIYTIYEVSVVVYFLQELKIENN